MKNSLWFEGLTDALGFMGGSLLGFGLGRLFGLDIFDQGYSNSVIGGIKKRKPQRRSKGAKNHWQRQEAAQLARRGSAMQGTPILPSGV